MSPPTQAALPASSWTARFRAFIRRRTEREQDADDVVQEVMARFVELSTGSWSFGEVAAWLYRAARNELIDRSRKKQELSIFSLDPGASEEETEIAEVLLGSARTPEEEAMRALFWRRLQEALEALPAAQREVFVATELEGRSFKELAAESGVGVNTLLSRKHSAVLSLREALRDLHQEICTPDS